MLLPISKDVDEECRPENSAIHRLVTRSPSFVRKTAAAVFTIGTGCSLGPEGLAVEVGMTVSRLCITEFPIENKSNKPPEDWVTKRTQRNRLLLACGAAAGVSAGFNAPIAGVFFALEIVQGAFQKNNAEAIANETNRNNKAPLASIVFQHFGRVARVRSLCSNRTSFVGQASRARTIRLHSQDTSY